MALPTHPPARPPLRFLTVSYLLAVISAVSPLTIADFLLELEHELGFCFS